VLTILKRKFGYICHPLALGPHTWTRTLNPFAGKVSTLSLAP
jgi:hypothetical protein